MLFRTAEPEPLTAADFTGDQACSAANHPGTCAGLMGNGFGDGSNERIFSSALIEADLQDYLYVVVGDGANPVKVYRLADAVDGALNLQSG